MSKKYISDHKGRKIDEKINYIDKTLPTKLNSIDSDIAELQMEKADKRSALTKTEMENHKRAILLDHPDGSVTDEKIGNRTVDNPETENSTVSGYLTTLFNMFSLAIRNIKDNKVDKIAGKGLSTEDYTTVEKNKLAGIESGANKYAHPPTHPASIIEENKDKRFVTDTEKEEWNNKQDPLIAGKNIDITDNVISSKDGMFGTILIMKDENGFYARDDGLGNHMVCWSSMGYFAFPLGATVV